MKGNVNKRLDSIIHLLMKYARDKAFDRITKIEKGKSTKRTKVIHDRHSKSLELAISQVSENGANSWQVKSESSKLVYDLAKEHNQCPYNCFIKCQQCSICIHIFTCTCADSVQHGTICKHIHLLMRYIKEKQPQDTSTSVPESQLKYTTPLLNSVKMSMSANFKDRILQKLQQIATYVYHCSETESIISIEKSYLNPCLYRIELCRTQRSPTPANKQIEKQNFFSTKRKRQSSRIRLGKPSIQEKGEIKAALLQTTIPESQYSESTIYNIIMVAIGTIRITTIIYRDCSRYSLSCGGPRSCTSPLLHLKRFSV